MVDKAMPRLLLAHADPVAAACFQEHLALAGFDVVCGFDADAALHAIGESKFSAVILDPGLGRFPEIVAAGAASGNRGLVLYLPGSPEELLGTAATEFGAIGIPRSDDPVRAALETLAAELGNATLSPPSNVEPRRVSSMLAASAEAVRGLRDCGHRALTGPIRAEEIWKVFSIAHTAEQRTALAGRQQVAAFAESLAALAYNFYSQPALIRPSVVRTLMNGVDFLARLLDGDAGARLRPPWDCPVLAVDDETLAAQALAAALGCAGLNVVTRNKADAAIELLRGYRFDLVFLDVGMPGSNGFELCKQLRAIPHHEKTPVVFLTGMATFQNKVEATLSGGNDFLAKPFHFAEVPVKALMWVYRSQLGGL